MSRPIREFIEEKAAVQRAVAELEDHDCAVIVWRKDDRLHYEFFGEEQAVVAIGLLEWGKFQFMHGQWEVAQEEEDGDDDC